jgi:phosphoribosyl 1,2-cyclic phosphodiesterase
MALCFTVLGSGSTGNSTLISDGDTHILVDIGLSGRETARRLRECRIEPGDISAVVISHEHGDHCRGVAPFAKKLDIPIFITEEALSASGILLDACRFRPIQSGVGFEVCGFQFTPFPVSHDSVEPLGFAIEKSGVKIAVAMDLGYISNLVIERLRDCDGIILESNHDINMLKAGPYPWALKQRVMSRRGHLSNDAVAEFLAGESFDGKARLLMLSHLSKNNNLPEIALLSAQRAMEGRSSLSSSQTTLKLADPDRISQTFSF